MENKARFSASEPGFFMAQENKHSVGEVTPQTARFDEPLALKSGEAGCEIEGPMALVILGGLATSTALNLLVLPTLALRLGRFGLAKLKD